jgi:thiamine-monophosphate kinase
VSGRLGEAELGLRALRSARGKIRSNDAATRKHLYPEPRIALGQWLADHRLATAAMDLSDGLSTDLTRLCNASKVGASIDAAKLPSARVPKRDTTRSRIAGKIDALDLALNGGDDYELLFTVSPDKVRQIPASYLGLKLTAIGEVTDGDVLKLLRRNGPTSALKPGGWDPFRTS